VSSELAARWFRQAVTIDLDTAANADRRQFAEFFAAVQPRLRRALSAAYGPDAGYEATAEALAWAWEHWDRVAGMEAPVPYLYRVVQTRSRRPKIPVFTDRTVWAEPWVEPVLAGDLTRLSERQRVAVMLMHAYGWTAGEVGELLGVSAPTVKTHVRRALTQLKRELQGGNGGD
jgi:DNA-directed RNA polymerase specialized sigma24 family protein